MAQGMQVYNEDGTLDVDVTSRLPRLLGSATIGGSKTSGTIQNAGITANNNIWWFLLSATTNYAASYGDKVQYEYPTITQGNGCLNWKFPSGRKLSCTIIYGVY